MGLPEPSTPIQAEQVSFAEMDTGTRPLAMGSVEPSGPIPAENLDSQKVHSVESKFLFMYAFQRNDMLFLTFCLITICHLQSL